LNGWLGTGSAKRQSGKIDDKESKSSGATPSELQWEAAIRDQALEVARASISVATTDLYVQFFRLDNALSFTFALPLPYPAGFPRHQVRDQAFQAPRVEKTNRDCKITSKPF
jgi:hypothetical protein